MAATAMSTVSLSIVGAYMTMLDAKYVVAALILNMFSTFIVLSVINPTRPGSEQEIKLEKLHESQSFFEMLGEYILAGFKVAMIILAMLIGFIALISAINALFATLFGLSFQQIPRLRLLSAGVAYRHPAERCAKRWQHHGHQTGR